jgi:hypothetical protein
MGQLLNNKNNNDNNNDKIKLDRKVLAELAANEPFAFRSIVQVVEHVSNNANRNSSNNNKKAAAAVSAAGR